MIKKIVFSSIDVILYTSTDYNKDVRVTVRLSFKDAYYNLIGETLIISKENEDLSETHKIYVLKDIKEFKTNK